MLVEIPIPDIPIPDIPVSAGTSTPAARRLIEDARQRIEEFTRSRRPRIDNFVVCDFDLVDAAIDWICQSRLLCGDAFCEWGSGFGVVTLLAALHGLDASGIEVEPSLVEQAECLADDHHVDATFVEGSFIPDGGAEATELAADVAHVETETPSAYDLLAREIADFDLVFAFPWPGEEWYWNELFDRFASDGALLLTYHGIEQLRLQRHSVTTGV